MHCLKFQCMLEYADHLWCVLYETSRRTSYILANVILKQISFRFENQQMKWGCGTHGIDWFTYPIESMYDQRKFG